MYADYRRSRPIDPIGVAGAAIIGGAIVAALINVAPHIILGTEIKEFTATNIPAPTPTPTPVVKREVKKLVEAPNSHIVVPPQPTILPPQPPIFADTTVKLDPPPPPVPVGTGEPKTIDPPVTPTPPLFAAEVDPRYADDFQPPYPTDRLRAEVEGAITVRVQIGADGRVKAIEPVGRQDNSFFEATRRQALAHWRFKPATRGGVALESWKTMTVRFQIS